NRPPPLSTRFPYTTLFRSYASWKRVIGPKLFNEFLVRVRTDNSSDRSALPGVPQVVVEGAFTGGGAQIDQTGADHHIDFNDTISWSTGSHLVKAGIIWPGISRQSSLDRSNAQGTFFFSSLSDYQQARPFSFLPQAYQRSLL